MVEPNSITSRSPVETVEVFIESRAELFGQSRARLTRGLGNSSVFADFLIIRPIPHESQGRVLRGAATTATRIRTATATRFRIDPLRLQEQFDGFGFRGDPAKPPELAGPSQVARRSAAGGSTGLSSRNLATAGRRRAGHASRRLD